MIVVERFQTFTGSLGAECKLYLAPIRSYFPLSRGTAYPILIQLATTTAGCSIRR
jgi:hypothetical protein